MSPKERWKRGWSLYRLLRFRLYKDVPHLLDERYCAIKPTHYNWLYRGEYSRLIDHAKWLRQNFNEAFRELIGLSIKCNYIPLSEEEEYHD
jgi:hypothetical protein